MPQISGMHVLALFLSFVRAADAPGGPEAAPLASPDVQGLRHGPCRPPRASPAGEVMTSHDILRVCQHLMNSNSTAADRNLSLNNWLLSTCGRSDDGRLVFQADFCPPKLIKSLGGHAQRPPCMHNLAHIFNSLYPQHANLYGTCNSQCSAM